MKSKSLPLFALLLLSLCALMGFEPADVLFADCGSRPPAAADCSTFRAEGAGRAKNVILMVGDGMGLNQIYAGRVKVNGPNQPFVWENFPSRGRVTTCSMSGITDSAAASTALQTGHKTLNGMIAYDPQDRPLVNITDVIHSRRAVGVVSTVRIWDATPAGGTAHASLRSQNRNISSELIRKVKPEVIMGGGGAAFKPQSSGSDLERADLIAEAKQGGYLFAATAAELKALDLDHAPRVLALFNDQDMTYEIDRKPDTTEPQLHEMAAAALNVLDNDPRGFYLMIEGGAIDHACHGTNLDRAIGEVAEFNRTIELVLAWMKDHPDTLLIITADHETGGMETVPGNYQQGDRVKVRWKKAILPGMAGHSSQKVGVFATGPNAAAIRPDMQNTEIFCVMKNAFGE